jgi:hypothetical protein
MLREALGAIVTLLFTSSCSLSRPVATYTRAERWRNTRRYLFYSRYSTAFKPPVRLHYPSLRDFLLNSQRCRDVCFWIDERKAHEAPANHCMRLTSKNLQRDIYRFGNPGAKGAQVLSNNLACCLSAELQYACRYWVNHLQRSEHQLSDDGRVHCFLRERLHWVEALSWIEHSLEGIRAIALLESLVNVSYILSSSKYNN